MVLAIPCVRCCRVFKITGELAGRKIRCQSCGQVQRIPNFPTTSANESAAVYLLAPESPTVAPAPMPQRDDLAQESRLKTVGKHRKTNRERAVWASIGQASLLQFESLGLIVLSTADILVTYVLLRRGPAFYESNPVAQWFFLRWNIAGMAVFKLGAMGLVVVIGEIVERHRPGWGRVLLLASCLVTAVVVWYGLRLLLGHGDDGVALE